MSLVKKKIFIITGEPSGDYIASELVKDIFKISANYNFDIIFYAVGGDFLNKMGVPLLLHIEKLSIIGIWEALLKIFHVKKIITFTVDEILKFQPDLVISIDSSGYTHRVDKVLKKINPHIKIIHYVAPPVWAWRKWRAKTMYKFIDKLLVLFPFETHLFPKLKTIFVGHPINNDADFNENAHIKHCCDNNENIKYNIKKKKFNIIILPGSRFAEIEKHIAILCDVTTLLWKNSIHCNICIPTLANFREILFKKTANWKIIPEIIISKSKKINAYINADIAIAASGTVTLELAAMCIPSIIIYKTSWFTALIVKFLLNIKFISLINILAEKQVVPELIQNKCTSINIYNHINELLTDNNLYLQQKACLENVMQKINAPKHAAAIEILDSLLC